MASAEGTVGDALGNSGSMPAGQLAAVVQALEAGWADGGGER